MKFTNLIICATVLTLTAFPADKTSAALLIGEDVLTLNVTFHTQEIDSSLSANLGGGPLQTGRYKIVETTLDTADVLNALAKDLGVTSNGVAGFPEGSYLVVTGISNTMVKSSSYGQTWDVSPYLQYSLGSDVVLLHGTIPPGPYPGGDVPIIPETFLVHVHFEDADHLADFTGIANSQPTGVDPSSETCLPSASGSGMLNGMPALITAQANLMFQPLQGPVKLAGFRSR
jgi:hypothetical protein